MALLPNQVGVPDLDANAGVVSTTDDLVDVGSSFDQTKLNANFATVAEKINLILRAIRRENLVKNTDIQ